MSSNKRPLVIAHRGASADFPENSLDAFSGAFEQGADWIELDVRRTKDGVLVVHHDLQTLSDYFDWTLLLNVRKIALGPTKKVLTEANLKEAYGGRTPFIGKLADHHDNVNQTISTK